MRKKKIKQLQKIAESLEKFCKENEIEYLDMCIINNHIQINDGKANGKIDLFKKEQKWYKF